MRRSNLLLLLPAGCLNQAPPRQPPLCFWEDAFLLILALVAKEGTIAAVVVAAAGASCTPRLRVVGVVVLGEENAPLAKALSTSRSTRPSKALALGAGRHMTRTNRFSPRRTTIRLAYPTAARSDHVRD
ncbi:unnamed protein product, partial [Ectocarpus sp. 8 AP-2014]